MLQKTKAIVLHTIKYGDSSLIIDMLTEEEGRLAFIARVPKSSKGKMKKQYFQAMTLLDILFDSRPKGQLLHLKEAQIALPYATIPFNPIKSSILLFLAEFLLYATRSEQNNPALFRFVATSMEWLDNAKADFANFHLTFMLRLSKFIGFYPNLEEDSSYSFFDLRDGEFTPFVPLHTDYLKQEEAQLLQKLFRMNFDTMRLFRFSRQERNRITELILRYYSLHIPNMPKINSLQILQELFD